MALGDAEIGSDRSHFGEAHRDHIAGLRIARLESVRSSGVSEGAALVHNSNACPAQATNLKIIRFWRATPGTAPLLRSATL